MPNRRSPYANGAGTTTLADDLRQIARREQMDSLVRLNGVDAETLRCVADKLEANELEIESLRAHSRNVHRALCEAIEDLDALGPAPSVFFMFIPASTPFAPDSLTPRQFSDLAVYLLDENE